MMSTEKTMAALQIYGGITQGKAKLWFVLRSLVMVVLCLIILASISAPFIGEVHLGSIFVAIANPIAYGFMLASMIENHLLLMIRVKIADDQFSLDSETNDNTTT